MKVAVLGASTKPERFANKAVKKLQAHAHTVIPINPAYAEVEGLPAKRDLDELSPGEVDTITVYMNPGRTKGLAPAFLHAKPRRVIFNPGSESPALADELRAAGIDVVEACTLVMLKTGQFDH